MKTTAFNYSRFAFNIIMKKKSTIIMPLLVLISSFVLGLVINFAINEKYLSLTSYLYAFAILIITVIFASIKALNIFKDFEQEGLELITLSKPLSRSNLVLGKLLTLTYFGLIWSGVLTISALLALYGVYSINYWILYSLLYLFVGLCAYLLISLITSLIANKLNQKIAITLPLAFFIPLSLGGALLSINSTTNINNAAYFINKKYPYHLAGNEANVEPFFINNNKDELLILPNGLNNEQFSKQQHQYLNDLMKLSQNSSIEWQVYSWLSLPYQLLDVFNKDNKNVFESIQPNSYSNLSYYIYYNDLDRITYKYKLDTEPKYTKYQTIRQGKATNNYITSGLIKSNSVIDNVANSGVIYAREGASEINNDFPEDNSQFSAQNNLVGKLYWTNVKEALKDKQFNKIAAEFVAKININNDNLNDLHNTLMSKISEYVNDSKSPINQYKNANITIFNEFAVKEQKLQSEIERKIYFAASLMYYIYFNHQDTKLFKAMIKNTSINNSYGNNQIKLTINGFVYKIGGFDSINKELYIKKGENGKNDKVIVRYNLTDSNNNYLFTASPQMYSINRDKLVVNKNLYFALWIGTIAILFTSVYFVYKRKEYK
ncbi:ABC transporter, permease protein [Mycoplasmopsis bovigenitalium 51080]|uniref:ABC transporter, permease protein n=2 Tax=Mycoplasmopsis bovigenitalium TaxID=2112 RepID=N9VB67_9BACT|nr:ABC transporter, permease protein [Mycoplasmopsis bovigenitalium 51080]